MPKSKSKQTVSGIKLKSYYGKNSPGEFPYISGIHKDMYLEKLWREKKAPWKVW